MRLKLHLFIYTVIWANISWAQTVDITEGCGSIISTFTAPAGATSYYWNFDKNEGLKSPIDPTNNTYSETFEVGTYVVTFQESPSGPAIGTPITITVYPKPILSLSPTTVEGCHPLSVDFEATSDHPDQFIEHFVFTFGDGNLGIAEDGKITHQYSSVVNSSFSLKLESTIDGCNTTKLFPNSVNIAAPPKASFNVSPSASCSAPQEFVFTNTTTDPLDLTYEWTLANGTTKIKEKDLPSQTETTDGSFTYRLKVSNVYGCEDSIEKTVTVGDGNLFADFNIMDTVCINETILLENTSSIGSSQLWTFDAGTSIPESDQPNPIIPKSNQRDPIIRYSTPGTHTIDLITFIGSCQSTPVTKNVYVEAPKVTASVNPINSCKTPAEVNFSASSQTNITAWEWKVTDKSETYDIAGQNFTYEYMISDSTYHRRDMRHVLEAKLFATTASGCIAKDTIYHTVKLPWAKFSPDVTQGCIPLKIKYTDQSKSSLSAIKEWEWDYGDGSAPEIFTTSENPTKTITTPGEYSIRLKITTEDGCTDTARITVKAGDLMTPSFTATPLEVCPGENVTFTNTTPNQELYSNWNYSANRAAISHCSTDPTPTVQFVDSIGLQSITLSANYNGCISSVTEDDYINVKGPIAHIEFLQECINPNDLILTDKSVGATSITWDFGDNSSVSDTLSTFTHTYNATGDYNVLLIAENATSGCSPSIKIKTINIRNIEANFTSDTLLCQQTSYQNISYAFNGSNSKDVESSCYQGYTWFFSDNLKRPLTSPFSTVITSFPTKGIQTVSLVTKDINGCTDTATQTIRVFEASSAFELSDDRICLPDTIKFTELAQSLNDTTIVKWDWSYGDGTANTTNQNPADHIYKNISSSSISIMLSTEDTLGCKSQTEKKIQIYEPTSTISVDPNKSTFCLGDPIKFTTSQFTTEGSSLSYRWNFGEVIADTTSGNDLDHVYQTSGTYIVQVAFKEIATACEGSTSDTITVQDYPVATIQSSPIDDISKPICLDEALLQFNSASTINGVLSNSLLDFSWSVDDIVKSSDPSYAPPAFDEGEFDIKLTTTTKAGACSHDTTVTLKVVDVSAKLNIDKQSICQGDSVRVNLSDIKGVENIKWSFGDGIADETNATALTHTYGFPTKGTIPINVIISDALNSCKPPTLSTNVIVHTVEADFAINNDLDTANCLNDATILKSTSTSTPTNTITHWNWNLGDGQLKSEENLNYTYADTGVYSIQLIAENRNLGCKDSITKNVRINPIPILSTRDTTVCKGDNIILSVDSIINSYDYLWTPTDELADATLPIQRFTGTLSNSYKVTATDTNNCFKTAIADVTVIQPLTPDEWDTLIVIGDSVQLPLAKENQRVQFVWNTDLNLTCTDCDYPKTQPLEDIEYIVEMTDSACPHIDPVERLFTILIRPETFIKLPTTFTPNGDGKNDIIHVRGWGIKDLIVFEIYNRWGELVFETTDIEEGWDGYHKGILQNNDTYTYRATVYTWKEETFIAEGHFNLMR